MKCMWCGTEYRYNLDHGAAACEQAQLRKDLDEAPRELARDHNDALEVTHDLRLTLEAAEKRAAEAERALKEQREMYGALLSKWNDTCDEITGSDTRKSRARQSARLAEAERAAIDMRSLWESSEVAHKQAVAKLAEAELERDRALAMNAEVTAWLIEYSDGAAWYWTGESRESFSRDPMMAIRFSREEDAQRLIDKMVVSDVVLIEDGALRRGLYAADHMWCGGPDLASAPGTKEAP